MGDSSALAACKPGEVGGTANRQAVLHRNSEDEELLSPKDVTTFVMLSVNEPQGAKSSRVLRGINMLRDGF